MTATAAQPATRTPYLSGQTVVVIGGSSGIGFATARLARAEGADVILTGRNSDRLARAASDLGAKGTAAFDAMDFGRLDEFFADLRDSIDHVVVSGGGPYYAPLAEVDFVRARRDVEQRLFLPIQVARLAVGKLRPGGSLVLIGGIGGRAAIGRSVIGALTAGLPALTRNLALEIAPIRVNLVAPGFVDTPLSANLLGDQFEARRERLRTILPIGRVVGPEDVASVTVHLMTNTALTGATYEVDGGSQLVTA